MDTDEAMAELLKTQKSLTEWLVDIGHSESDKIKAEDNDKRERLAVLNDIIDLPFDRPVKFAAQDLASNSAEHQSYLLDSADKKCALRLIPLDTNLPKLRMRGLTTKDAYLWFKEQNIDPEKYRAEYLPHESNAEWATIFIVNEQGIFGEIIRGGHFQLTQGFYDKELPINFSYNFDEWLMSREDEEALQHLKFIAKHIKVEDKLKQDRIINDLNVKFHSSYIGGYWETSFSQEFKLFFIDFNITLGEMYSEFNSQPKSISVSSVGGLIASPGSAEGIARVIDITDLESPNFKEGDILVCSMTTPAYVPLMKLSAGIITDMGGILSHAAIVARELGKPCIVGTQNATKLIKDGELLTINTDEAVVK